MQRVRYLPAKLFAGFIAGALLVPLSAYSIAAGAEPSTRVPDPAESRSAPAITTTSVFLPMITNNVNLAPTIGGCPFYPANNIWNVPVNTLPVHARSDSWVHSIGR